MKRYNITVNGKTYDVTVEEAGGAAPAAPVSGTDVKAPMPGTILEVKAAVGDTVSRGQVIFTLEAMKMANDIVAPVDGKIVSLTAKKGDSVNANDVLAVVG